MTPSDSYLQGSPGKHNIERRILLLDCQLFTHAHQDSGLQFEEETAKHMTKGMLLCPALLAMRSDCAWMFSGAFSSAPIQEHCSNALWMLSVSC